MSTVRLYPVVELSLLVRAHFPHANERAVEGDIVNVRLLRGAGGSGDGYGTGTTSRFINFLMQGLEWQQISRLTDPLTDPVDEEGLELTPGFDKRRFCVPFHRLKQE